MPEALEALATAIIELEEDETLRLTQEVLDEGTTTSLAILQTCQQAMRVVGERYERGEYYLAALILAGEMFKEVADLVQPDPVEEYKGEQLGVILLGTVAGDIHDIGKNMFAQALRTFGFNVTDLGVDVPKDRFLEEALRTRPDVVCLSGLISVAFESMKQVVDLLREHQSELGYMPPVVLGGGTIDNEVCRYSGADSWSTDAMEGVRICERLVGERAREVAS
jgi:methanogenic corrinoid protein MtbC1